MDRTKISKNFRDVYRSQFVKKIINFIMLHSCTFQFLLQDVITTEITKKHYYTSWTKHVFKRISTAKELPEEFKWIAEAKCWTSKTPATI